MSEKELHAVTGAFGYTGKYIAKKLLDEGYQVITLTNSLERENPFEGKIKAYPYNFDNESKLVESLQGVSVLYNTYWVRFNYKNFSHKQALKNSLTLFNAAKKAGVKRIVHISITNPDNSRDLEYFTMKVELENALKKLGISYAILRPALVFGKEDILINNIAWCLRNFPFFMMFGDGMSIIQPIYVEDLAELAVENAKKDENITIDAVGPEIFSYNALIEEIGISIGKLRPIVSVPPSIGYLFASILGKFVGDVLLTKDEVNCLLSNLLCSDEEPTGKTVLSEWLRKNKDTIGKKYANELKRRQDKLKAYPDL